MGRKGADAKNFTLWIQKFNRAARERLKVSKFLFAHGFYLESMYFGGYVVECGFKAIILSRTPRSRREEVFREMTAGEKGHRFELLKALLQDSGCSVPLIQAGFLREIARAHWATDWRYEVGGRTKKEAGAFLQNIEGFLEWTERNQ
jgi:hypothetical protein